jgi:chromosomal replication initiation ATPase DnaA
MQKPKSDNGQIPLALPVEPRISREDLLESPSNQLAVDLVDRWPDWPSNIVILAGPIGSGKTHLARVWAGLSNAEVMLMDELARYPDIAKTHSLVLEDAGNTKLDEEALFHAINQARAHDKFLLITSRSFPSSWVVELPDLLSRLKLAHIVELQEPDDALLSGLMFKLFADRQLVVSPSVIDYLVNRMERSMEIAGSLVNWLDREALARHRKINRAMASEALTALGIS